MPDSPALAPLKVQVIGWTHFEPPTDVPWETDVDGGQALAEFAGRACYQSWSKPNPSTATNAGYTVVTRIRSSSTTFIGDSQASSKRREA